MLYVTEMSKWMQSPEFLRLIPERKELAIAVVQAHLKQLMGSLPGGGAATAQQNQAAVGTPTGPAIPSGQAGNAG